MASNNEGGNGLPFYPHHTSDSGPGASPAIGFARLTRDPNAQGPPINAIPQKKRRKPLEKKLNLNELVKMLYRGRWIILTTFILVFAYTVYTTYSKPFIYASGTRMFIEKKPVATQLHAIQADDDHSISNQIQFFKSHVISQHVARLMHDYALGHRGELDSLFTEYFGSTNAIPPDPAQLAIIRMVDNPKLPAQRGIPPIWMLEARSEAAVSIAPDAGNDYLLVTTEAYTPLDAAFIANVFVVVYAKDNLARSRSNSAALKEFLAAQAKRSADTLYQVESQLKTYLRESNGLSIEQKATELTAQLEQTKIKHENLLIDIAQRQKVYADLVANRDTVEKVFYQNLTLEPSIVILQNQIAGLEADLDNIKATNTVMNPLTKRYVADQMRSNQEKISTLKERLREKAQELIHSQVVVVTDGGNGSGGGSSANSGATPESVTKLREAILSNKLRIGQDELVAGKLAELMARLQGEISLMPDKIIQAGQLKRAEGSAERLYTQLEDKYMDAWLAEQSVFGSVKLEDPAALNPTPIRPNRQGSILTGSLLGLAIGIGVVVMISFIDSTIRSPDEVESHGFTVLATIPIIQPMQQPKQDVLPAGGGILPKFTAHRVAFLDARSSIAESYRSLRTAIQFASLDREIRSIAITSSVPQEGKSTTSANLAIVMAQMGKRTLLVDTDLRRPTVHSVFGVRREPGLTNVLFDRASLFESIHKTDVPNLSILPCGIIPPNPAELLGSEKMRKLITELTEMYDMVIFDTPPVVAVTDALLLGMNADAMIVIARADSTKADALVRSLDTVERSGARLLGVVLNNFNVANAYGAYYRYYQYYNYYSADTPTKKTMMQRLGVPLIFQRGKKTS
jgi:capsular exopolysaccharide synthesis family protein